MEEYFFTKKSDLHFLCHLIWPRWFNFLVHECLNLTRFSSVFHMLFAYSRKKKALIKMWKKNQKFYLPTYPIFLEHVTSVLYPDAFPYCWISISNKYVKQVVLINHSWISPTLQKGWELEFCLFFKKWGRVQFSPRKGEVGKM